MPDRVGICRIVSENVGSCRTMSEHVGMICRTKHLPRKMKLFRSQAQKSPLSPEYKTQNLNPNQIINQTLMQSLSRRQAQQNGN